MKTIKSILGIFTLTLFMGTTAFAQDQDVDVEKDIETDQGEAQYEFEKEKDNGEIEKEADYYGETDTDQRESETELEHESESKTESGLTQEDLDRRAEKAAQGQDDTGSDVQGQQGQDNQYVGTAQTEQEQRTEIEPERLPKAVTDSITEGDYAAWTISRVYTIVPEEGQMQTESQQGQTEYETQDQTEYETQDQSQLGQEQGRDQATADVVLYEIYFLDPESNQVESERYDERGSVR